MRGGDPETRQTMIWPRRFSSGGVMLAMIVTGWLTGCGTEPETGPRTAAQAGRSVFGADEADSNEDRALSADEPAGPSVPDPRALEDEENRSVALGGEVSPHDSQSSPDPRSAGKTLPDQPVTARRPAPTEKSPPRPMAMARVPSRVTKDRVTKDPSAYPGGIVPALATAEPLPGGPRLLVPKNTFKTVGNPPALRLTYDDLDLLKVLNLGNPLPSNVVEMMPDWLTDLEGKRVRIRGFMYPQYTTQLTGFVLTRDMGVCCFGPNPRVYYLIAVKLKEGTSVQYIPGRPFDVVGTFHITPVDDGQGNWFQLWSMDNAVVMQ